MAQPNPQDLPTRLRGLRTKIKVLLAQERIAIYLDALNTSIRKPDNPHALKDAIAASVEVNLSDIEADAVDIKLKFGVRAIDSIAETLGHRHMVQRIHLRHDIDGTSLVLDSSRLPRDVQVRAAALRARLEKVFAQYLADLRAIGFRSVTSAHAADVASLVEGLAKSIKDTLSAAETLLDDHDDISTFTVLAGWFREVAGAHLTAKAELERELKDVFDSQFRDLKTKAVRQNTLIQGLQVRRDEAARKNEELPKQLQALEMKQQEAEAALDAVEDEVGSARTEREALLGRLEEVRRRRR